jgi:hypothetical protein
VPAVMVVKAQTNNVPDAPGRWQRGEVVVTGEQDQQWGFQEMPINNQGSADVATINALDPASIPLYGSYKATDTGTITTGNTTGIADHGPAELLSHPHQ